MSLFIRTSPKGEQARESTASQLIEPREGKRTSAFAPVTPDAALRHSAVWACLRLRADLISTMPIDVVAYGPRGERFGAPLPPVMVSPDGGGMTWTEWVYASQVDLDSQGNTVGVIEEVDGAGRPKVIRLVSASKVVYRGVGSKITEYKVGKETYSPGQIWHEKQYALAGMGVGLSPLAYAAATLNGYASAQDYVSSWFESSATPGGHLQYQDQLDPAEARFAKERFRASISGGDVFVSGKEWEFKPVSATAASSQFLESMQASVVEVCRYLSVPADMIDGAVSGSSVTYANISQRNLQLLITNIGPAIHRREMAWGRMLPPGQVARLNTNAILRLDPAQRMVNHVAAINAKIYPPSRALALEDMPPLTPDELGEFNDSGGARAAAEVSQKVYLAVGKVLTIQEAREIVKATGAVLTATTDEVKADLPAPGQQGPPDGTPPQ